MKTLKTISKAKKYLTSFASLKGISFEEFKQCQWTGPNGGFSADSVCGDFVAEIEAIKQGFIAKVICMDGEYAGQAIFRKFVEA